MIRLGRFPTGELLREVSHMQVVHLGRFPTGGLLREVSHRWSV